MAQSDDKAVWYYVGQYGELGPLTYQQISDLVEDRVIDLDTHVWREGMSEWKQAQEIAELRRIISSGDGFGSAVPPPRPPASTTGGAATPSAASGAGSTAIQARARYEQDTTLRARRQWRELEASLPRSDKSRITAGLLNFIPGVGRFYLGYAAHGVLQILVTLITCGFGYLWPLIDAIFILTGGVKYDGYGRVLED